MGLQDLNPKNLPKKAKASEEGKERKSLANKLIKPEAPGKPPKKLTSADRKKIFQYLTGEEYTVSRGRPSARGRNLRVAIDFLFRMGEMVGTEDTIIKQRLAKEYDLPGQNISETERVISDSNFSKIVARNLDELESYFIQYVDEVDHGFIKNGGKSYDNALTCLKGLSRYKENKKK